MLLYVTLGSNDIPRSKKFYDVTLATLGYECHVENENEVGYRQPNDTARPSECRIWVLKPILKLPATWGNGTTIALATETRQAVDAFYSAAMQSGGTDEGNPGLRPFHENFYACFVRDPDGNKLAAVCEKSV